jgi:hypothetical protein
MPSARMKTPTVLLLACAWAALAMAENAATPNAPKPAAKPAALVTLQMADAKITAPLVLKDGAIGQPAQTEVADGGKATITFKLEHAGDYVLYGIVNAPEEDQNSFYLNIDAPPKDPEMIWDIDVTKGFEERVVSWRGNGSPEEDEFKPKVFTLAAGEHQLYIVGREPGQLKSLSIHPARK